MVESFQELILTVYFLVKCLEFETMGFCRGPSGG
jgi:hypothetical protein